MEYTSHAVISASGLTRYYNGALTQEPLECTSLETLALAGLSRNFTHVWIRGNAGVSNRAENLPATGERWQYFDGYYTDDAKRDVLRGAGARLKDGTPGRKRLAIAFTDSCTWANPVEPTWIQQATDKQLLTTLLYLEKEFGVPVSGSPATVGWKLLTSLHPEWIKDVPAIDLREHHFTPGAAHELIWQSPEVSAARGYLHKFDKSMAYPYAASGSDARYGKGTPVHVQGTSYDAGKIGVWRCTVKPVAFAPLPDIKYGEWIAGPLVRLLCALGCSVEVHEGWIFPEHHTLLNQWAKRMWNARQSFRNVEQWKNHTAMHFAEQATKQIAVSTIGFTAYRDFTEEQAEKRRPDIRLQTVARHIELTYHNLLKIYKDTGQAPVMTYMDAAYYCSENPRGREALPDIVRREGLFGGWKYEGTLQIDSEVADILSSKLNPARKLELLNGKGWTYNA